MKSKEVAECLHCGGDDGLEAFGGCYLCIHCRPDENGESAATTEQDASPESDDAPSADGTASGSRDADGYYNSPITLDEDTVRDHYHRVQSVYETLAEVDGYPTIGLNDHHGWYIKRPRPKPPSQEGRCATFAADCETLVDRVERTIYATTSYKSRTALAEWVPCSYDNGTKWHPESPMPDYGDLRAFAAWGDIDLCDEVKPRRGQLDADERNTIERALAAYMDEFADLYGTRDAVCALDSGGGAYVFGAPEATLPIAQVFEDDGDALERLMSEFRERSNDWLARAETRVNDRVAGADSLLDPDWVNNKNRQYKAPLALHGDHDAVVTPLSVPDEDGDAAAVDYALTPIEDVDEELVRNAEAWAEEFTAVDHVACVDSLVATLWPDYYEDAETWSEALRNWVADDRQREKEREQVHARSRDGTETTATAGAPVTADKDAVTKALDQLNPVRVAEKTIVHRWTNESDDNSGDGKRAFVPTWGTNATGTANFIRKNPGPNEAWWVDTGNDSPGPDYGGPVVMACIADGWMGSRHPTGEDWGRGVQKLRDLGFEVPVWVPEQGSQRPDGGVYDQTPLWALRKAAVALGVLPEHAFVERESDDGGTYQGFPGATSYNRTLAELEEIGIGHGREKVGDGSHLPTRTELGLDEEPEDEDEKMQQFLAELKLSG